jgi:diaminohydroxyphosphoribosylaminopyrimidine deaminase/5-amino-6-(5-phosphoribosylamino)uracil reductase
LAAAGVAEVRFAAFDPNPAVSGRGQAALRAAGIRAEHDAAFESAAWGLVEAHAKFSRTGKPLVIAKFASSLDGKIAARDGSATWITGPQARETAHRLRSAVDAVLVGGTTILADDSQLTARPRGRVAPRQPLRVVVDSIGATPSDAKVIAAPGCCLIAVGSEARDADVERLRAAGAEVVRFPSDGRLVDMQALLQHLAERGCINILAEGGGRVLGALFDGGLVDKVTAFLAPAIIGGGDAPTAVAGEGAATIADTLRLHDVTVRRAGADVLVTGYVQPRRTLMGAG